MDPRTGKPGLFPCYRFPFYCKPTEIFMMPPSYRPRHIAAALALSIATAVTPSLQAQTASATTVPVGFVTLNIAAGTVSAKSSTIISLPLQDPATATGQMVGRITGLTANTISNSNAGWTPGQLSAVAKPHQIRITSGAAQGLTFLLSTSTANSATTVTLNSIDAAQAGNLTSLGILTGTNGDTYEIFPCETLSSAFGTPATTGIVGSDSITNADVVQVFSSGLWTQYYYNTTGTPSWRASGSPFSSDNLAIRADSAIIFLRAGLTPLALSATGTVPSVPRKVRIANTGTTFIASGWPTNLVLADFGFGTAAIPGLGGSGISSIPGWVKSTNQSLADKVQTLESGIWKQYYHNGSGWKQVSLPTTFDKNTTPLPAASGYFLIRATPTSGYTTLSQNLPYSLQ